MYTLVTLNCAQMANMLATHIFDSQLKIVYFHNDTCKEQFTMCTYSRISIPYNRFMLKRGVRIRLARPNERRQKKQHIRIHMQTKQNTR